MKRAMILMGALVFTVTAGCKDDGKPAEGEKKVETDAPRAEGVEKETVDTKEAKTEASDQSKCEQLGCEGGKGDFFEKCKCKGEKTKAPLSAKYSGKDSDFFKKPEFEVTNETDRPIHWASAAIYYYDKSGKQLTVTLKDKPYEAARVNGSNFTLKPQETKSIAIGWTKKTEPKNLGHMEVVFDGWCFGEYKDKASHECMTIERAPKERAPLQK